MHSAPSPLPSRLSLLSLLALLSAPPLPSAFPLPRSPSLLRLSPTPALWSSSPALLCLPSFSSFRPLAAPVSSTCPPPPAPAPAHLS
eukprot:130914-Rhodomonas_salina.2